MTTLSGGGGGGISWLGWVVVGLVDAAGGISAAAATSETGIACVAIGIKTGAVASAAVAGGLAAVSN